MPLAKRVLIISVISGVLLIAIGIFQSFREDMDIFGNLNDGNNDFSYQFVKDTPASLQQLNWFQKTNQVQHYNYKIPQTDLALQIQSNSYQPESQSSFYFDSVSVALSGQKSGEQVHFYVSTVQNKQDEFGTTYQVSTLRLDLCKYTWWKRVLKIDYQEYCQGELQSTTFQLFSNGPISKV